MSVLAELTESINALAELDPQNPLWDAYLILALRALANHLGRVESELAQIKREQQGA